MFINSRPGNVKPSSIAHGFNRGQYVIPEFFFTFMLINKMMMNKNETPVKEESPGVAFAKAMLERKRQTIKEAQEEYRSSPKLQKLVQELKERNAKRGTPIVRL